MRKGRLLAVMLLAAVSSGAAAATPPASAWDLPRLMQALAQVKTAKAHFVQEKYLWMLDQPLKSSGELRYVAPDRLEKQTLAPQPETFILAGSELTVTAEGHSRSLSLQTYPEAGLLAESIRAVLSGNLAELRRLYRLDFTADAAAWRLQLVPRDPAAAKSIKSILIAGSGAALGKIDVRDNNDDRTVMTIVPDAS